MVIESKKTAVVAVITRTKDRAIMLSRAAASVKGQKYRDFVWVVVNDGGDPGPVDKIVQNTGLSNVQVIHHPVNKGMEAASNSGIRSVDSRYIVIHDDDDTWAPEFLQETVSFLESERGQSFGGVITDAVHIEEKIVDEAIKFVLRKKWEPLLSFYPRGAVHLADICVINQFPPIAFLFRRAVGEKLGFYDESLPVLGDWDFNLRFLRECDISVMSRPLAYYHHRPSITASNAHYGNSVHAGFDRHSTYEAIIRNKHIRLGLEGADPVFANLLCSGRQALSERMKNSSANRMADAVFHRLAKFIKRWQR